MSEIRTCLKTKVLLVWFQYSECQKSKLVWITDSLVSPISRQFRFQTVSEIQTKNFGFRNFFLSEFWTHKIQMGSKIWISDRNKVSEIQTFVFGFQTLFYLHTSDTLLPSTYSSMLNAEVSKQNQKSLLQVI